EGVAGAEGRGRGGSGHGGEVLGHGMDLHEGRGSGQGEGGPGLEVELGAVQAAPAAEVPVLEGATGARPEMPPAVRRDCVGEAADAGADGRGPAAGELV